MAVTEADVRKIAELARLSLEDTAVLTLTAELNGILEHMDVLQQVDTSSVAPTAGIGADGAPLRGDAVSPPPMNVPAQSLTAETRDGFILVPRLSTHEEL